MVFFGILTSAGMSFVTALVAIRLGPFTGMIDMPDDPELKRHVIPAVPLGGIGIYLGLLVGLAAMGHLSAFLAIGAGAVVTLGLVDDRIGLTPMSRLACEVVIAAATVWLGPVSNVYEQPLSALAGVVLILIGINAVNLFDGLDALAGSSALVALVGLAVVQGGRAVDSSMALVAAAGVAGFLLLNRPPARVFLGDNGAYLLGYLLALGVLQASPDGIGSDMVVVSLVFGVFFFDLLATIIRRRLAGAAMFAGDRNHLYDRLHDAGMRTTTVALVAGIAQVVFSVVAWTLDQIRAVWTGLSVILLLVVVATLVAVAPRTST